MGAVLTLSGAGMTFVISSFRSIGTGNCHSCSLDKLA
jgi:hypothetical protein